MDGSATKTLLAGRARFTSWPRETSSCKSRSAARVEAIEKAYRLLLRSKLNTTQALEKMRGTLSHSEDVLTLIRFVESAERGLTK